MNIALFTTASIVCHNTSSIIAFLGSHINQLGQGNCGLWDQTENFPAGGDTLMLLNQLMDITITITIYVDLQHPMHQSTSKHAYHMYGDSYEYLHVPSTCLYEPYWLLDVLKFAVYNAQFKSKTAWVHNQVLVCRHVLHVHGNAISAVLLAAWIWFP